MDRASFELIGNVGKLEIKPLKSDRKLAIVSIATSERWKAETGDWNEKTYWHRVVVFAPAKVALIEKAVQVGARLRLVGQIRPGSWEDERGHVFCRDASCFQCASIQQQTPCKHLQIKS